MRLPKSILAACLAAGFLSGVAYGQNIPKAAPKAPASKTDPAMLKTNADKASYVVGRNMAQQIKAMPFKISQDVLVRAILDEFAGAEMPISKEQIQAAMTALDAEITAETEKKAAGDKQFLVENAKKEGVKTTKSGLQYKVLKEGTGAAPKATDHVTTHYEGRLVDGTVFDSSIKRGEPATFPVNGVIAGWTEALQMMKVGGKWQLYIPAELAYGDSPRPGGPIYPGATLVFDIELLGTAPAPARGEELPPN